MLRSGRLSDTRKRKRCINGVRVYKHESDLLQASG